MRSVGEFTKTGETIRSSGEQVDLISTTIPRAVKKPSTRVVVFNTGSGGLGKMIQATALLDSIKDTFKGSDIHIITASPIIFQSIPGINQVWKAGTPNLFNLIDETYNKIIWLQYEPYHNQDYIRGKKHLIHVWNDALGLFPLDCITPVLKLTVPEIREGVDIVRQHDKPTVLIQITGGAVKYAKDNDGREVFLRPPMFYRNISPKIMQDVVNSLTNEYSFIQVAKRGQPILKHVTPLVDKEIRTIFSVVRACHSIVCIDSFLQHAAAAFNKKATVLWGATRPHCLGYDLHNNMYRRACPTPLCNRPNSFLHDTTPDGNPWVCPLGAPCLEHDQQLIIEAIKDRKDNR